jgi:LacI family transcriptional regulator
MKKSLIHKPMQNLTLNEIAIHCGVGKSTVSRAFNNDPEVSIATRERILAAAKKLGYSPSQHESARRLALQKYGRKVLNQVISTIFPHYFHQAPYFLRIANGILDVLSSVNYAVLQVLANNNSSVEPTYPTIFSRGEVDGIILGSQIPELLNAFREDYGFSDRPIVSVIHNMPGCSSVLADDFSGGYQLTKHLLKSGHRHILHFYDNVDESVFGKRHAGMVHAMKEWNLDPEIYLHPCHWHWIGPLDPAHVSEKLSTYLHGANADLFEKNIAGFLKDLNDKPEITAIVATNDITAMQIWQILSDANLSVPERYSLIGFDDVASNISDLSGSSLTTIRVPLEEIGRKAAELLLKKLTEDKTGNCEIVLPVELIIRESTSVIAE